MGGSPYSELYPTCTLCPCLSFFTQASLYTLIHVHYLLHSQHMCFKHFLLEALKSPKIIQTLSPTTTFSNSQSGAITKGFIFKKLIVTFFTSILIQTNQHYLHMPWEAEQTVGESSNYQHKKGLIEGWHGVSETCSRHSYPK